MKIRRKLAALMLNMMTRNLRLLERRAGASFEFEGSQRHIGLDSDVVANRQCSLDSKKPAKALAASMSCCSLRLLKQTDVYTLRKADERFSRQGLFEHERDLRAGLDEGFLCCSFSID